MSTLWGRSLACPAEAAFQLRRSPSAFPRVVAPTASGDSECPGGREKTAAQRRYQLPTTCRPYADMSLSAW